jgi:hypothetical protein
MPRRNGAINQKNERKERACPKKYHNKQLDEDPRAEAVRHPEKAAPDDRVHEDNQSPKSIQITDSGPRLGLIQFICLFIFQEWLSPELLQHRRVLEKVPALN